MNAHHRRIVREELFRSIAWIALGMVGWPILISEVPWLETTALTVFGLPVFTWALLTTTAIAIRTATSVELQVQTPVGLSMSLVLSIMLGGVGAVYLVAVAGYNPIWVTAIYVGVTIGTVLWYWFQGFPDSVGGTAT